MNIGDGGMCNKLFILAHIISSSENREFDVKFYYFPYFEGIDYNFDKLSDKIQIKNQIKVFSDLFGMCGKHGLSVSRLICINDSNKARAFLNDYIITGQIIKKTYFWIGWPYVDYESLKKKYNMIRDFFTFSSEVINESNKKLERKDNEYIIAVHIRRGDYKNWLDGKYYFENETYIRLINEAIQENKDKQVKVLICCNEAIKEEFKISHGEVIIYDSNSDVLDLCMMSMSDLIIGPPSTFSGWASFIGHVPKFYVMSKDSTFNKSESAICYMEKDGMGNAI
ncbi:alpha-1,2-fucosyltransferase [Butyrivibrio fibrisolvens]|uniref:alpha-1,2-fucosyltransferase n=1 Tax=Butyrivibrio fibrisolvens TaxID=831 RepID=UPI000418549A|nr:alpha-1,2-fucosyltransferase [Butyrivibrio fibrisolvens]